MQCSYWFCSSAERSLGGPRAPVAAGAASSHRKNAFVSSASQMLRCKVLQPGDRCPALSGCRLSRPKRLPAHPETWTEADVRRQSTQVAARYQVTSDRPIRCLETLGRPMGGPGLRAERPDVKPRGRRSRTVSPVVPQ